MGVGDGKAVGGVAGDRGLVTRHVHFLHRIGDGLARVVHVQIGEAARPVVVRVEGERFVGVLPVGQQADGDCIRALAVLVVRVVPDLFNGKIHKLGIGIGDLDIPYLRRFGIVNDLGDVLPDAGVGKYDLAGRAAVLIGRIRVIVQRCDEPVVPGYVHGDVIRRVLIGLVYLQAVKAVVIDGFFPYAVQQLVFDRLSLGRARRPGGDHHGTPVPRQGSREEAAVIERPVCMAAGRVFLYLKPDVRDADGPCAQAGCRQLGALRQVEIFRFTAGLRDRIGIAADPVDSPAPEGLVHFAPEDGDPVLPAIGEGIGHGAGFTVAGNGDCQRPFQLFDLRIVQPGNGLLYDDIGRFRPGVINRLVRHLYRYAVGKEVGEVGKPRPMQLGVLLAAFQGVIAALFHHQVSPAGFGLHKGDFPLLLRAGIGGVPSVPGIFQMHAQRTGAFGYVLVVAVDGVAAGAVGYGVIGRMIGHAVDRLEDLIRSFPDDFPPRFVRKGRIRVKRHRLGRRRVKFGGDVVERHVDFVVRGKGPHAADQIARFKAHAHAVVRRAGVHVNAGVVHHHRDGGAVFQIARRRARFDQVVVALREQLVVAEDEQPVRARDAGQQGVAGGGIAAVRQRHIVHGVERKGRACERPILLVHFQHAQLVAEVGHIEVGKELALHAGTLGKRVHEPGVVTVDVLHGVRLGIVVEHAVFGVVAPVCGERVIVFGNIAGQLVNRDLPGAAGTQLKPAGVFRQGRPNVLPAAASLDRPSVDGVAVDGPPVVAVLHEDHAEHLPWRCA